MPAIKEELASPIEDRDLNELQSSAAQNMAEAPERTNAAEMQGVRDPVEVQNMQQPTRTEMR